MGSRFDQLIGVDLCACGPSHTIKCDGVCRHAHTLPDGKIKCGEKYQYIPPREKRRPKFDKRTR